MDHAKALADALREVIAAYYENTCQHDETHRGGAIWTICDRCGAKWADDQGGFKPFKADRRIVAAENLLAHPAEAATRENEGKCCTSGCGCWCENEAERSSCVYWLSTHQQQGAEKIANPNFISPQIFKDARSAFVAHNEDPPMTGEMWDYADFVAVAAYNAALSRAPQPDTATEAIRHTASQGTYDEMAIRKAVSFGLAELIVAERAALAARGKAG